MKFASSRLPVVIPWRAVTENIPVGEVPMRLPAAKTFSPQNRRSLCIRIPAGRIIGVHAARGNVVQSHVVIRRQGQGAGARLRTDAAVWVMSPVPDWLVRTLRLPLLAEKSILLR